MGGRKCLTPMVVAALTTKKNKVLVSHDSGLNPDIARDERGEFMRRAARLWQNGRWPSVDYCAFPIATDDIEGLR